MASIIDKLSARGIKSLTDGELLGILTEDPQATEALLKASAGSLRRLSETDPARLRMIGGIGLKRAAQILAAAEIGRRITLEEGREADTITHSDDVVRIFRPRLEGLTHEECWAIFLTSSNRIIEYMRISQGGVQATVVDHRLVIKRALELLATQIILIHNHPSGAASASPHDRTLTDRVARAAALFDIRLLDHVIISREGDFSFRREGLIE